MRRFRKMTSSAYRASGSEADIQAGICQLLTLLRIPHSVTNAALTIDRGRIAGRSVTTSGWPDVTAAIPPAGRLAAIETKSATGRLRPSQVLCLESLREAGALVCIPRSLEEFARFLIEAGIEHEMLTKLAA